MKKLFSSLLLVLYTLCVIGQEVNETEKNKTKFSDFTAKSGEIVSFEDFNKITFSSLLATLSINKRLVKRGNEQKMFLMFDLPTKYSTRKAAIAEEDIKDLLNAIGTLQNDASIDINTNSQYMEKYYETVDNFKIGYYVSNKQVKWYVDLDTRLSESTFFLKDINDFTAKVQETIK
jgi:hypothetical protein